MQTYRKTIGLSLDIKDHHVPDVSDVAQRVSEYIEELVTVEGKEKLVKELGADVVMFLEHVSKHANYQISCENAEAEQNQESDRLDMVPC